MAETIETKIIKIGSSLGILIPKKVIVSEGLSVGDMVEVSFFLKKKRLLLLKKALGAARGAGPFVRENEPDRI
ncbi:MAG: hypothetical protein KGH98_04405 [Candidatus Micrarchaeota archaeon]|nr:hypothetical protein [Candidatus Micrarchaeota archaeon]